MTCVADVVNDVLGLTWHSKVLSAWCDWRHMATACLACEARAVCFQQAEIRGGE